VREQMKVLKDGADFQSLIFHAPAIVGVGDPRFLALVVTVDRALVDCFESVQTPEQRRFAAT
jgi:hypothetical protein